MKRQYAVIVEQGMLCRAKLRACLARAIMASGWTHFGIKTFSEPLTAAKFVSENEAPVVIIGDGTREMDAINMIRSVRKVKTRTNFICITNQKERIVHSLRLGLRLSGCITERPNYKNIKAQLEDLWYPIQSQNA